MTATPEKSVPQAPGPDLPRELLWLVLGVIGLATAVLVGVKIGDARHADEERHDPLREVRARAAALSSQVKTQVPDLLGAGELASSAAVAATQAELDALSGEALREGVAVDLSDAEAALVRAGFERALRSREWTLAEAGVARFAGRPEGMILDARLALARGRETAPEPLKVLADAPNPRLAEAARVLLARMIREQRPEEALALLQTGVDPARTPGERLGPELFLAVRRLDPQAVAERLESLAASPEGEALRRAAALQTARQGMRLAEARPVPLPRLSEALRIVIQLEFRALRSTEEGERLALAVSRAASELQQQATSGRDLAGAVLLLERLGEAGLRASSSSEVEGLADRWSQAEPNLDHERLRIRGLAALVRLDVRLFRAHLAAVVPESLEALPKDPVSSCLRGRVGLAQGVAGAGAALGRLAESKQLGPIQRARCLFEGGRASEDAELEASHVQRALTLDPGSPWIRIGFADVLARQGKRDLALDEAEGAHVLFDRVARERPGEDADRLEFLRRLCLVHAHRGDEDLTAVFLRTLEKRGDPQLEAVRARATKALGR